MSSASWQSEPAAWVAKLDPKGRVVWSTEEPSGTHAERVSVDAQGRVYAVGRSDEALWVRAYDPAGVVRWEQEFGGPAEDLVGLGPARDGSDGVWVLLGRESIDAWHVAPDGVSEDGERVLEYRDVYTLDTGPAWALAGGAFYFPELSLVASPGQGGQTWELDERDPSVPAVTAVDERQVAFASAVGSATLWYGEDLAVTLSQDGQSLRHALGEHEGEPDPSWGLPWVDDPELALEWFAGVEPGELASVLSGESRVETIEVLLLGDPQRACEPILIPVGCSESEIAETGSWVEEECQRAVLLGALLEDTTRTEVEGWSESLATIIESLPDEHPLGESLELSLDNHRVPEIAVSLGHNEAYREGALQWLESNGHHEALATLETELVEAGEACEFVADVRAALAGMGRPVAPFRLGQYADACDQLYDLCAGGEGIASMIPVGGYHHVETCDDDFSDDDNGVEPCEEVDTRSSDELLELVTEEMVDRCAHDVVHWGEFDPEGNCGVLVANDEHTVEFESAGPGRWMLAEHFVSWTIEAP